MTIARLRVRLEKLRAGRWAVACRCDRGDDARDGPPPADADTLRAKCPRCGGDYALVIIEEIVEAGMPAGELRTADTRASAEPTYRGREGRR